MTITSYVRVHKGKIVERGLPEPVGDQNKLAEHKPRILPYEEKRPALKVGETYGDMVEDIQAKKVVATWPVVTITMDSLAGTVEMKVRQIKEEAQRRILEIMPMHKQLNWTARAIELSLTHGSDPTNWPEEDRAAVPEVLAQYEQIKAIREESDAIEAALLSLTKPADILAFDARAA